MDPPTRALTVTTDDDVALHAELTGTGSGVLSLLRREPLSEFADDIDAQLVELRRGHYVRRRA